MRDSVGDLLAALHLKGLVTERTQNLAAHAAESPLRLVTVMNAAAIGAANAMAHTALVSPETAALIGAATYASIMAAYAGPATMQKGGMTSPFVSAGGGLALLHKKRTGDTFQRKHVPAGRPSAPRPYLRLNYYAYQGQNRESMKMDAKTMFRAIQTEQRRQMAPS